MQKHLLIVVESYVRWMFFSRMRRAIENMGYKLLFFTTCPSVYVEASRSGATIRLVANKRLYDGVIPENVYLETLDVKAGELTSDGAERFARMVYANLCDVHKTFKADQVFIYNGTTLFGAIAGHFARERGIKTAYFEIANLPGRMFIDPDGTGGFSRVYRTPAVLDKFNYDLAAFSDWRKNFTEQKLTNGFVPQVVHGKDSAIKYLLYAVDKVYFSKLVGEGLRYISCYTDKFRKAFLQRPHIRYDELSIAADKRYIFYPMQVSHDSQLLLHSQTDNSNAIHWANELAKEYQAELIVKPHPAETDKSQLSKLYELKQQLGFTLTGSNTMQLVNNAQAVVTINSTVGLEAKIAGKKVYTLGKAVYAHFDDTDLARYVQDYLVKMDYFSAKPIEESAVKQILSRAEAC